MEITVNWLLQQKKKITVAKPQKHCFSLNHSLTSLISVVHPLAHTGLLECVYKWNKEIDKELMADQINSLSEAFKKQNNMKAQRRPHKGWIKNWLGFGSQTVPKIK